MTITANYQICNLAFSMMGSPYAFDQEMTSATFTAPTTQHHVEAVRFYDTVLRALLSEFNWNFAKKRIVIDSSNFVIAVTSGTNASPGVLTATAHGIPEGCGIILSDFNITDLDNHIAIAKNVAANTLELYYPDGITKYDTTSVGTIGTGSIRLHPISEYDYKFKLPSDFIRLWSVTEYASRWEIEGSTYLLTDDYNPQIEYVSLIEDVTKFPAQFIVCFARKIARELAAPMSDKIEYLAILYKAYIQDLKLAMQLNVMQSFEKGTGNNKRFYQESSWVMAGK